MTPEILDGFDFEAYVVDLGDWEIIELVQALMESGRLPATMTVWIPLSCFGSSQSHSDLCWDLVKASYMAEMLGKYAEALQVDFEQTKSSSSYKITLSKPSHEIWEALKHGAILYTEEEEEALKLWGMDNIYIADQVSEYEEHINEIVPLAPDIIDHYYMNLIHGVYEDSDYEEVATHDLKTFPERRIGYSRSAVSRVLGVDCYVGTIRWAVPSSIDLDRYFEVANEKFRLSQFEPSRQLVDGNTIYEFGKTVALRFSYSDFADCRAVSEHLLEFCPPATRNDYHLAPNPVSRNRCLIHETGAAALFDDGVWCHIFYGLKKLSSSETKQLVDAAGELAADAAELIGVGKVVTLPWHTIDDDQFEMLCYDVIWLDPRFDDQTIKKMGKSRSRDGGRDIVVHEKPRLGAKPRKWIFQCKLVRDGSSLTPSKVQNIGDMLEQYEAGGFGIMTSTVIDATLYDRAEVICKGRGLAEGHFSVYELERILARNQSVRDRYFKR